MLREEDQATRRVIILHFDNFTSFGSYAEYFLFDLMYRISLCSALTRSSAAVRSVHAINSASRSSGFCLGEGGGDGGGIATRFRTCSFGMDAGTAVGGVRGFRDPPIASAEETQYNACVRLCVKKLLGMMLCCSQNKEINNSTILR